MPELDKANGSPAYNCGRLLAIYDNIQWKYDSNIGKKLSSQYLNAVLKQPAVFMPKLAEMANVYMTKVEHQIYYKKLLGELAEKIGTQFPTKFNDIERGEFILGFYQQQAETFKHTLNDTANIDDTEVETDE